MKYTIEKAADYTLVFRTAEMVMDVGASYAAESDAAQTLVVTEEINREVDRMCNLSEGIYDKGRLDGRQEGRRNTLFDLIQKGYLSILVGAEEAGMEPSQFEKEYKEYLLTADISQKQSV